MRAAILLFLCQPAMAVAQTAIANSEVAELKRQGYAFCEGRWRLPQEIAYLQAAASRRAAAPAPAAPAPVAAAAKTPVAAKAPAARSPRRAAHRDRPQQQRNSSSTGILTVRMQYSQLLGMDTVSVGFGTGQARLQLPRTQTISIGTTVAVPMR